MYTITYSMAALDLAGAPQEKVWVQVRLGEGAGAVEQEQERLFSCR